VVSSRNFPGSSVFLVRVDGFMSWLRRVSYPVLLVLVFLLHCSQTCLTAGHTPAAVTAPASSQQGPAPTPCHSTPAAPHGTPNTCPDCRDHVFLRAVSAEANPWATARSLFLPLCVLTASVLPEVRQPHADVLWPDATALSPPPYLFLSVLRL